MGIQFHLTNRCNLRCKHCYQGDYQGITMSLDNFKIVLDKILPNHNDFIHITGGEPFIIPNFMDYVKYASPKFKRIAILTNGLFINDDICKQLQEIPNLKPIQVSLEGTKEINDEIRGKGVYDKVLEKIELLHKYNIKTTLSCTIAKYNYDIIDKLYYELDKNSSLDYMWFDRCIPFKQHEYLTMEEFAIFILKLKEIHKLYLDKKTRLFPKNLRALQFFANDKCITSTYQCSAGTKVIIVMENGDIMPCRRLDYRIGNIFEESFESIMERNKNFIEAIHKVPDDCKSCKFGEYCRGGLKCLTFNKFGDFNHKDINCVL